MKKTKQGTRFFGVKSGREMLIVNLMDSTTYGKTLSSIFMGHGRLLIRETKNPSERYENKEKTVYNEVSATAVVKK